MFRIFSKDKLEIEKKIELNEDQKHHLFNVLRMSFGDKIEIVDNNGDLYLAELNRSGNFMTIAEKDYSSEAKLNVTIFQGFPKKSKFESIIKMATEIGAKSFVPVEMKRSVARIKSSKIDQLKDRWNKIALSASKQSKRREIPSIENPLKFSELINKLNDFDLVVCLYQNNYEKSFKDIKIDETIKDVALIIGPEGGFSKQEIEKLEEIEIATQFISLGKRILRTETAGVVGLSILLFLAGDI